MLRIKNRRTNRRVGSLLSLALIASALVILPATPALAAPTLTITPMTWDVIGLDSNRPQTAGNPNTYPQRFKVCNTDATSAAPSTNLLWTWGADNHSGQQKIDFVTGAGQASKTVSLGTIAAGSCKIASYLVNITQAKASIGQYRQYSLAASATDAATVNLATRTLWVESFVSQNRNAIISTTWRSLTDGTNPCSSATSCSVYEGQRYQITLTGKTSTSYQQIQQFLTLPDNIMTIDSIKTTFATPSNTSVNQEYGDGCGWAGPTITSSGTCDGAPDPKISGGKAGGNPIKTVYTVTINSNASTQAAASIFPMITDNSGSSFHYNTDAATKAITLTPKKAADLSITKTHANSATSSAFIQGTAGTTSTGNRYVLTITNNGPTATAGTITVADTLPSGLTIPASTLIGSSGATFTNSTAATNGCPVTSSGASPVTSVSCSTTTSIASGGTATLTLPIAVPAGQAKGQVANTATVAMSTGATDSVDVNTANNSSTDSATIAAPPDADLIVTNTHTGNFTRGGTATWSLTLKNDGPQAVDSPQIVDTLPSGITYSGFTGTNWSCNAVGQVVTCTYSQSLASGATASTLQISGTVGAGAADVVTNSATGSATGTDPNSLNNTNITDKAIVGQADMSLTISHSGSFTIPSSSGTFNFAVSNAGPDAASSPSFVFTLPAKMTYVSVGGATGWTCSGVPSSPTTSQAQVVTCTRSTSIGSGSTSNITITVAVDSTTVDATTFPISGIACSGTVQSSTVSGQTIYSCPVIGGSGFATYDPDTTFNSAEDSVQAYVGADMGVTITPSSTVAAGNSVIYTMTVSNAGPNSATNPFFLLSLPTGFTCNTGTASACVGSLSAPYATTGGTPTLATANFDNSCSTSAQEVICPPSGTTTLLSGQSFQATVTVATSTTATPTGENTIPVITAADQGDTNQTNNSANVKTTITGGNSAPAVTVTFNSSATTAVNESSTSTYTYDWTASDSGGDTISSFVASCGDAGTKVGGDTITAGGTGTASISGTFVCKFDDGPLTSLVTVNATDNRSLTGTGTNTVTISNVVPTAVLSAPGSVSTSSNFTVSLGSPADASGTDTSAGFTYAFGCGSGTLGDFGTATSTTCTAPSSAGSVTVKGQIKDKDGGFTEYSKSVTVAVTNTAPTGTGLTHAGNNKVVISEDDISELITLPATDADGDTITYKVTSIPANGTLYKGNSTADADKITQAMVDAGSVTLATNTVTFVVNANYNNGSSNFGPTFGYTATDASGSNTATAATVEIDVNPINDPTVAADSTITTSSGTASVNLVNLTTDTETASASHVYKITALPAAGTLKDGATTISSAPYTMTNGTTVTYTQPANRAAADDVSFTYSATDTGDPVGCGSVLAGSCTAAITDSATITVDITNAAPTATAQTGGTKVSVTEDGAVTITLAGTDPESDTLTFKITSLPSNGKLYKGTDTTEEITSVASPVTLAGNTVHFVPTANYNNGSSASGPSFNFTVTDASGSNTASSAATVDIDVNPANDAPTWDATVSMNATATLDLRTVSADQETADDNLTYSIVTNGTKGTASLSGTNNRILSYTKTAGQTGNDTAVTIRVTDTGDPAGCGATSAGVCDGPKTTDKAITITIGNNPPIASVTMYTVPNTGAAEALSSTLAPKTNDTIKAKITCGDVDGDNVTLTIVWKVKRSDNTTVTLTSETSTISAGTCSGTYSDTLDLSRAGYGDKGEQIIVEVTPNDGTVDGTKAISSTTVVISDTPPTATDRIVKTGVDQTKVIVLEGSDIDGENVTFSITQQPSSGSLSAVVDANKDCFVAAGTVQKLGAYDSPGTKTCHLNVTFTPPSGQTGDITFKYKVQNLDNGIAVGSRIATVTVKVQTAAVTGTSQTDDAEQETVQGALVSTGANPSSEDPVESQIVAVKNGRIIITEEPVDQSPPSGFSFFGQQVDIQVLDANDDPVVTTASNPQRFTFKLDPSIVPSGKTASDVKVYRDGTELSDCTGGSDLVQPTPACVLSRTTTSGVVEIRILTTAASVWNFAVPVTTSGGGGGSAPPSPTPTPTPTETVDPTEPPEDIDPPRVKIRMSDSTPKRGERFLVKLRLAVCPGHEFTTLQLGYMRGEEWMKIGEKRVDGECHTQWRFKANFKKRSYRAIWAQQDDDHRQGRSRIRTVVPHGRLPGPQVKLFVNDETPDLGEVIVFRTRIKRCSGLEGDRIQLWRLVPGVSKAEAKDRPGLLIMKDGVYRKLKTKRVDRNCYAEFRMTVNFERATFRTIWPKQDPRYRQGRAEPVVVRVDGFAAAGSASGSPVASPTPAPMPSASPTATTSPLPSPTG